MEVLFFVLAVYGSIFIFAYFVVFLLLIIIVPLIIIWEIIKALWIFKGLSKQQKIDLMPSFLFVGYTALAIGIGIFTDVPIGFVIASWVIATIIMAICSSGFHDKPLNKKEKADLIFGLIFIAYTAIAIGIGVLSDVPIGFVIASWVVVTAVVIVWLNKIAERFDDKPVDAKEQIDLVFGAVFVSSAALLMAVIFYSNSDALIGFCVVAWLVIITSMGFWSYNKRKRIKNQDQDNP